MLPLMKKVRASDPATRQLQDAVSEVLQPLTEVEILDGILIERVYIPTGAVKIIDHKLDRALRGWIVVGQNANAVLWDSQDSNRIPYKTLRLNSSANVTVSLWLF